MKKILIIEDDLEISNMLKDFLVKNGCDVILAHTGVQGLEMAVATDLDLVLLDLMLPFKSGDVLLSELRQVSDVPVIIISAKNLTMTKIEMLRLGADDFISKPFDLYELLARMEAVLKRTQKTSSSSADNTLDDVHTFDKITLNRSLMKVFIEDETIFLTQKEYMILELMILNPNKIFSKRNIYESVWGEDYAYDDNTINTHISNIRKKLKEFSNLDYIETVWGIGYRLQYQ